MSTRGRKLGALTSWVRAMFRTSSKVCQLSSLRIASRSSNPTWLSVATSMRIVSASVGQVSVEQAAVAEDDGERTCEFGHFE